MRVQHGCACVGVAQASLPYSHRHTLLIHHRLVAVPESVEPATRNPQPLALTKGQAEGLRNHLLAKGAQVSNAGNEPTKQTAEASSENR